MIKRWYTHFHLEGVFVVRVSHPACILVLVASFVLFACSARYDIVVGRDGSAQTDFSAFVGARTSNLISNLAGVSSSNKVLVLDAVSISKALKASPAVSSVSLRNPDARSLSGTVAVSRFDRFLSSRFIRVEITASGGSVSFSLDRVIAPEVLASLSPEIGDYLSALMAPIATGENLGNDEYFALVSSVYGDGVAREIRESKVTLSLKLPGPAVSARGGIISGEKAEFTFPLIDFLTLEKPVRLEAFWR
ncbi:MAG: hypothetical protein WCT14_02720 [Treponemataceae bacterium]